MLTYPILRSLTKEEIDFSLGISVRFQRKALTWTHEKSEEFFPITGYTSTTRGYGVIPEIQAVDRFFSQAVFPVVFSKHRKTLRDAVDVCRSAVKNKADGSIEFTYCPLIHTWFPIYIRMLSTLFDVVELRFDVARGAVYTLTFKRISKEYFRLGMSLLGVFIQALGQDHYDVATFTEEKFTHVQLCVFSVRLRNLIQKLTDKRMLQADHVCSKSLWFEETDYYARVKAVFSGFLRAGNRSYAIELRKLLDDGVDVLDWSEELCIENRLVLVGRSRVQEYSAFTNTDIVILNDFSRWDQRDALLVYAQMLLGDDSILPPVFVPVFPVEDHIRVDVQNVIVYSVLAEIQIWCYGWFMSDVLVFFEKPYGYFPQHLQDR